MNSNISIMNYLIIERCIQKYNFVSDVIYLGEAECHLSYILPETEFWEQAMVQ